MHALEQIVPLIPFCPKRAKHLVSLCAPQITLQINPLIRFLPNSAKNEIMLCSPQNFNIHYSTSEAASKTVLSHAMVLFLLADSSPKLVYPLVELASVQT